MKLPYLKKLFLFTLATALLSFVYFVYAYFTYPPTPENETFLGEVGEGFSSAGLWGLLLIYGRTLFKLLLGKGPLSHRILPGYTPPAAASSLRSVLEFADRTHPYVGVVTVALIALHALLSGGLGDNLFFPAVVLLLAWQTLFGLFLSWRYTPKELKKFAYPVHAQLLTGIMIGIFALFGHLLIDD